MSLEPPRLTRFDGPLDLLLELINRRALDITTISLAAVAEQYLEEVARLGDSDLERLAGYLVIASRLLLIKSQALLPRLPDPEELDDAADLVRQLEEYRVYKELAARLRSIEVQHPRMFPRQAIAATLPRLTPGSGQPASLVAAFARLLSLAPEVPVAETLTPPRFRVADKVQILARLLSVSERLDFNTLAEGSSCRAEVVAYFLALLELLRRGRAVAWQEGLFGRIVLARPTGEHEAHQEEAEGGADGVYDDVEEGAVAGGDEELV